MQRAELFEKLGRRALAERSGDRLFVGDRRHDLAFGRFAMR